MVIYHYPWEVAIFSHDGERRAVLRADLTAKNRDAEDHDDLMRQWTEDGMTGRRITIGPPVKMSKSKKNVVVI